MAEQETEQVTPEPEGEPDMTAPFFVEPKAEPELEPEPTPEPEPDKPAAEPPKPTVDKDAMLAQVLEQNKALAEKVAALETPGEADPKLELPEVDWDGLDPKQTADVITGGVVGVVKSLQEGFKQQLDDRDAAAEVRAVKAAHPDFDKYEGGERGFRFFYTTTNWTPAQCYEAAKQAAGVTEPAPAAPGEPAAPARTPAPRPTGPARPGHEAGGQKPPKPKAPKFNTIEEAAQWHFKQKYAELARKGEIMQLRDDIPEEE